MEVDPAETVSTLSPDSRRQKRKSEPPHVQQPERRIQESWEYPMSKEEKKDRVIFLFEQELSEAREEEQAMDDLMSQLERLEELRPGTAKRLKEAVRSIGLVEEVAGRTRWLRLRNSGWLARAGGCFLLLLVAAFFVYRSWSGAPTNPVSGELGGALPGTAETPAGDPEIQLRGNVSEATQLAGTVSTATVVTTTAAATVRTVVPPAAATLKTTSLDMVQRLRRLGHESLKRSDCYQAAHYFQLSREQLQKLEAMEASVTEVLGLQFSLLQDHAFALICSRRFQDGIALLEGCLTSTLKCDSKLLNALGYAFCQMEDLETAAKVFQMGLSEDPENPIIWNNLGAARMDLGELEAADFALDKAAAIAEKSQEHHPRQLAIANVQELEHRVKSGKAKNRAQVDIWFKETFADNEMRSKEL